MLRKLILAVLMAVATLGAVPAQTAEKKTPPLLKVVDTVVLPAVSRFDGAKAFTRANGIAWMGDDFQKFILPLVEEDIPEATILVSELARPAKDLRIAAELGVDERGEVSLAHFFGAIQDRISGIRTDGWANAAYIIGTDGNTWAVSASPNSVGWFLHAYPLGRRDGWDAGHRFLSR